MTSDMKSGYVPEVLSPEWTDYELIDCGGFEKLERFGRYVTVRPEPQAIGRKSLPEGEWERMATAVFRRDANSEERGKWLLRPGMPEQWYIAYRYRDMTLRMRLGLTSFKHVGVFPEQAENWKFIYDNVRVMQARLGREPRVLNLFAYTGGASLAARSAGADVTHVDSVRQVVTWSRGNMEASGLDGIRWVVEDAMKFVRREVRRGRRYDGIVLDPPAYGRGPEGEKWMLEQDLAGMLECCACLLSAADGFLVLNLYSMGLSALLAKSIAGQSFPVPSSEQFGELFFPDRAGKLLPLGVFYRARYGTAWEK